MVGTTVLQYQLLEKLGSGGMGDVYKAQDTRLNRFVAIKVLPAKMSTDPERRRRFIQEAQAASALNHPNIITIYDIVSQGDAQFMVMEFVSGSTLHDSIGPGGLPIPQVLQYGAQMADALGVAHAAGIIHRDLKPSNIMITQTGLVKILDFGLAKLTDLNPSGDKQATDLGPLTQEGTILGTVSYMSPEQAEGLPVDARSDIFSFGSVLYEMVSGRRAFDGGSSISTLSSVLRDDVKPFADVAPDTPPLLEAIISRCLPKDPNARWQSMKEVEKALTSLKRSLESSGESRGFPDATVRTADVPPAASASPASQTATVTTRPERPVPPAPQPAVQQPTPPAVSIPVEPPAPIAAPPPQAAGSSSKLGMVLGLAAVMILAAAAGWWWNNRRQAVQQSAAQVPASQTAPSSAAPADIPPLPPVPSEPGAASPAGSAHAGSAQSGSAQPGSAQVGSVPPLPPVNAETPAAGSPTPAQRRPSVALTPVTVGDALPLRITLQSDVPSDAPEGQALRFTAVDGLQVNNNTVIAKGATVTGTVMGETGKKKILGIGKGIKLTFRLLTATAVDGKKVNVRAMSARRNDGPTVRTFETSKGSKTKGLAAAQGAEYIAYIDGEQTVSVPKQ
jgi:serine/threonine-protein kinase